jgi:hypothetical protein
VTPSKLRKHIETLRSQETGEENNDGNNNEA